MKDAVSLVAILKDEDPFVEEWVAYHRIIGVERFFLYDNDQRLPLQKILEGHSDYVTVVPWASDGSALPGRNIQTKAYTDALPRIRTRWVTFIDADEFIVLRKHDSLGDFLAEYGEREVLRLRWHLFGHNGHFSNPPGLITSHLTRRRSIPGRQFKSLTRTDSILAIESAHECRLKSCPPRNPRGLGDPATPIDAVDPAIAHINHYLVRSFRQWMGRITRGDTAHNADNYPRDARHAWRFEPEACLRKFVVECVGLNEMPDDYMLRFAARIHDHLRVRAPSRLQGTGEAISMP